MELTYVLVLVIVGYTTASPYGYGTKGGAAAKADASAVAGSFTGVGDIPINNPSNAGYSGSFSKTYSSSSSASSASSSSGSFSYSGSGSVGFPGALGYIGANDCVSGNCHGSPSGASQGSAGAGSQAYSGTNVASSVGGFGGKLPSGSYGHKYSHGGSQLNQAPNCGPEGCQGTKYSESLSGSGAGTASQSISDSKVAASAGTILSTDSAGCGGSDCNNSPGSKIKCTSGECNSNKNIKCSSGNCGPDLHASAPSSHYGDNNICTSGQCGSNPNTDGRPSTDYGVNDIHVHTSGASNSQSIYGASLDSNNDKTANTVTASGCSNGNCGLSASVDVKPYQNPMTAPGNPTAPGFNKPATHLTTPKLEYPCTDLNCQKAQGYSTSFENNPSCIGGNCGHSKAPYNSNSGNFNDINQAHSSPSHVGSSNTKPHDSLPSPVKTLGSACTPGIPGCALTSPISGSFPSTPGYDGSTHIKPNYSQDASTSYSPIPSLSPSCAPGSPGCAITPSASGEPTNFKPSYSDGTPSSYTSGNPTGPACVPGAPGCAKVPSVSGSTACATGNCGASPSASDYGGSSDIKPNSSYGISSSHSPLNPLSPVCSPGTLGCSSTPSCFPGTPGCAVVQPECSFGNCAANPSTSVYIGSDGISSSYSPSGSACVPGTPGCAIVPSSSGASKPPGCTSATCGPAPSSGYGGSLNIKPSHHNGIPTSDSPANSLGPGCAPGTPGCTLASSVSSQSDCAAGNCGSVPSLPEYDISGLKPSHPHESSSSYSPVNPSGSVCSPGTTGCGSAPSSAGLGGTYFNKPSYAHGTSSSYSPVNPSSSICSPGTPGCVTAPPLTIKPSYSSGSFPSYTAVKPSEPSCEPGTPGCAIIATTITAPPSCASGNCGLYPSSAGYDGSFNIKPSYSHVNLPPYSSAQPSGQACAPGSPGCITTPIIGSSSCAPGTPECSQGSQTNAGHPTPGYGSSSIGSSLTQATFGSHGTGSIQSSLNKPSTFPTFSIRPSEGGTVAPGFTHSGHNSASGTSGSGSYTPGSAPGFSTVPSSPMAVLPSNIPGIGSPPYNIPTSGSSSGLNVIGASSGISVHGGAKDKPAYTGGFGGPTGILKPNEFSVTPTTIGSKPLIGSAILPATCISGSCLSGPASPSLAHSGSNSEAQASAAASASANAIAYTGGFGGPPGLLKPYDSGKIDIKGPSGKQLLDSSPDSQQGLGGSGGGTHSYTNGGLYSGGNAAAQANAVSFTSTGSHGNGEVSGCGGGCGGSVDHGGSLSQSNTGALDDSKHGADAAGVGAISKSVANASSAARAFGGSYASSSATAHATAGSSIKGGYGKR